MHCGNIAEQLKHQRRAAAVSTCWRCAIPTEVFLQIDLEHVCAEHFIELKHHKSTVNLQDGN